MFAACPLNPPKADAPAKYVKKAKKDHCKRRCLIVHLIHARCGRVLHHLPASNRPGNYVRCSRLQLSISPENM
jgi:hypothetical protein